jgi:hypothetical protein
MKHIHNLASTISAVAVLGGYGGLGIKGRYAPAGSPQGDIIMSS